MNTKHIASLASTIALALSMSACTPTHSNASHTNDTHNSVSTTSTVPTTTPSPTTQGGEGYYLQPNADTPDGKELMYGDISKAPAGSTPITKDKATKSIATHGEGVGSPTPTTHKPVAKPATKATSTTKSVAPTANSERIEEDDPRWDCKTMGNKQCGPTAEDGSTVNPNFYSGKDTDPRINMSDGTCWSMSKGEREAC